MTYRVGAHSTSDDDSKYRTEESPGAGWDSERSYWEARSPIVRFGRFLHTKGWFTVGDEENIRRAARREAIDALNRAERVGKPSSQHMFTDVWDEPPPVLRR
jgi:2-oxoisovalerate dehydrogenase E1 component alpha subunit